MLNKTISVFSLAMVARILYGHFVSARVVRIASHHII